MGAIAERARLGPVMLFTFIWTTIVYNPLAYWTWNANGWSFTMGGLDFAGGTPVHISSGTAALAISIYVCVSLSPSNNSALTAPRNSLASVVDTARSASRTSRTT